MLFIDMVCLIVGLAELTFCWGHYDREYVVTEGKAFAVMLIEVVASDVTKKVKSHHGTDTNRYNFPHPPMIGL
jgi:diphthamide synthase (EF-2-diphthine--ammonia ligase)